MEIKQLKRYLRIWRIHAKAALMQRMVARFNFLLIIIAVSANMATSILFIKIIFSFINNLSGWSFNQALVVVASYMMVEGLSWTLCAELAGIPKTIRLGTLDGLIVKPISTQYLVSVWRADPEDWARVATALIILGYSVSGLNLSWPEIIINGVLYFFLIACAFVIAYSLTLMIKSLAFWFTETGNLWTLASQTIHLSQYPTDIFFHWPVRMLFSTIVPLAFLATVPAKIFIHGFNFLLIAASILMAALFFIAARKFWKFALKHYSSASS